MCICIVLVCIMYMCIYILYMHVYMYMYYVYLYVGIFTHHIAHTEFMVTAASVMGVIKIGNIVPRAGMEPTSLASLASVLTITPLRLPDVTTLPKPTCLCGSLPDTVTGQCKHICTCVYEYVCLFAGFFTS